MKAPSKEIDGKSTQGT